MNEDNMPAPREIPHFIAGRPVSGTPARHGEVRDPATGDCVATVPFAGDAEVEAAVQAARSAQRGWGETPLARRAEVLFAMRAAVLQHRAELASIITSEQGKTLADAVGEVNRGIEVLEFACGIPNLLKGTFS
jgi:malonate-semialdehyde dehydrogenase (acetylating) / methylmalonate-semialdehyde dehydrogenase